MTPEILFRLLNLAVLPGWLLLIVAPRWRWTQLIAGLWLPAALAGVYIALLAAATSNLGLAGLSQMGELGGIQQLFQNPHALLAAWVHYLVFDLFIGAWQTRDATRRGVPQGAVVPCLLLTLMAGPLGLLSYLAVRRAFAFRSKPATPPALGEP